MSLISFFLNLEVGNIPYDATEEQLIQICEEVGPVVSFRSVQKCPRILGFFVIFSWLLCFGFSSDVDLDGLMNEGFICATIKNV